MATWKDIEDELIRMRQAWSCPRDLRNLGPGNFDLRTKLIDVMQRYTRGRCLDFAVRLAEVNPQLSLAGFYAGDDLVHAFLTVCDGDCLEVSGSWTLAEMRKLHANDCPCSLRRPSLSDVLRAMEENEQSGAEFDSSETVLTVAGCLPHLRPYVPRQYVADDPEEALRKIAEVSQNGFRMTSVSGPGI